MRIPETFLKLRLNRIALSFAIIGAALLLPFLLLPSSDEASRNDIARIAEFQHLRRTLGDAVWPGYGKAQIPFAMAKGKREYLFDHPSPPKGNTPIPTPIYPGSIAYTKGHALPRLIMAAIPVGGIPTAVMPDNATFDQAISLMGSSSDGSMLEAVMSGGTGTDAAIYELVAIHEGFHVFQLKQGVDRIQNKFDLPPGSLEEKVFRDRLRKAESTSEIANMIRIESRHLAQALSAKSLVVCRDEAQLFLKMRDARRQATAEKEKGLTVASIAAYEDGIEWSEGTTTYVQRRILELASAKTYKPLDLMTRVPGFNGYSRIQPSKIWSLDRSAEISYQARSYVVGAGICSLLDRLGAEWKSPAMEDLMSLTELLRQALETRSSPEQKKTWTSLSKQSY
jgi:hypothetical protein